MNRVLKPGGVYYAVTGCHTDNPLWPAWRTLVAERTNTVVQDRSVTDYARIFAEAGFTVSARKLAFDGFIPITRMAGRRIMPRPLIIIRKPRSSSASSSARGGRRRAGR